LMRAPGAGRPDAAPQSTPIPVTLVSVPLPEPPQVAPDVAEPVEQPSVPPSDPVAEPPPELALEPPAPQSVADSLPNPVSQVLEPVADLPPKPNQTLPVTSLKVASIRTRAPSRPAPFPRLRIAKPFPRPVSRRHVSPATRRPSRPPHLPPQKHRSRRCFSRRCKPRPGAATRRRPVSWVRLDRPSWRSNTATERFTSPALPKLPAHRCSTARHLRPFGTRVTRRLPAISPDARWSRSCT